MSQASIEGRTSSTRMGCPRSNFLERRRAKLAKSWIERAIPASDSFNAQGSSTPPDSSPTSRLSGSSAPSRFACSSRPSLSLRYQRFSSSFTRPSQLIPNLQARGHPGTACSSQLHSPEPRDMQASVPAPPPLGFSPPGVPEAQLCHRGKRQTNALRMHGSPFSGGMSPPPGADRPRMRKPTE